MVQIPHTHQERSCRAHELIEIYEENCENPFANTTAEINNLMRTLCQELAQQLESLDAPIDQKKSVSISTVSGPTLFKLLKDYTEKYDKKALHPIEAIETSFDKKLVEPETPTIPLNEANKDETTEVVPHRAETQQSEQPTPSTPVPSIEASTTNAHGNDLPIPQNPTQGPQQKQPRYEIQDTQTLLKEFAAMAVLNANEAALVAKKILRMPESDQTCLLSELTKQNTLNSKIVCNQVNTLKSIKQHYFFATWDNHNARKHGTTLRGNDFSKDSKYSELEGDALKTAILSDFKNTLSKIKNTEELRSTVEAFKKSSEFKLLNKGQDWATKLFSPILRTSSAKAVDSLINEKKKELKEEKRSPKPK